MNRQVELKVIDEGDEELDRIREVRHRISEELGHDPYRLVAYYMEMEKEHPERLVPAQDSALISKSRD